MIAPRIVPLARALVLLAVPSGVLFLACSNSAPPPPDNPRGATAETVAPAPPSAEPSASPTATATATVSGTSTLAPVPTVGPNVVAPAKGLKKGVTCDADGARCPEDHPICVVRTFSRCFSEEEVHREYPKTPGLPPILKGPCVGEEGCPPDRPYCISDAVTGCVPLATGESIAKAEVDKPNPDVGVYGQCTMASDCSKGNTCCRGFAGLGTAGCAPRCDLSNTQIHCSKDADCAPLRAMCSDKACRDKIHCEPSAMGFLQVCVGVP